MSQDKFGVDGPYFDELAVGDAVRAPAYTLTSGRAAVHHAILGGRLALSVDADLARAVTGRELADPAFVWDAAIGQSTAFTRRVIANLFYRGLALHRLPAIGDTLHTRTEVVGLRQTSSRPAGLAALRVQTHDQNGLLVLDFVRCAMLPLSAPEVRTGHAMDLSQLGPAELADTAGQLTSGWDTRQLPAEQFSAGQLSPGDSWQLQAGDVVSSAPELARLTLNLAHVHHDRFASPSGRLVYGGHTIGLALAHIARAVPQLLTVTGWTRCDHTGPVREGDTLYSQITLTSVRPGPGSLVRLGLHVIVRAGRDRAQPDPSQPSVEAGPALQDVLDWELTALALA